MDGFIQELGVAKRTSEWRRSDYGGAGHTSTEAVFRNCIGASTFGPALNKSISFFINTFPTPTAH
jgi:hypothetical protein